MKFCQFVAAHNHARILIVLAYVLIGCQSNQEAETPSEQAAKIPMYDRIRLTLADADAAGIHLFDLRKLRADIVALNETHPDLSKQLLADLDRLETLPKSETRARVAIGKEMYGRFRNPTQ